MYTDEIGTDDDPPLSDLINDLLTLPCGRTRQHPLVVSSHHYASVRTQTAVHEFGAHP